MLDNRKVLVQCLVDRGLGDRKVLVQCLLNRGLCDRKVLVQCLVNGTGLGLGRKGISIESGKWV